MKYVSLLLTIKLPYIKNLFEVSRSVRLSALGVVFVWSIQRCIEIILSLRLKSAILVLLINFSKFEILNRQCPLKCNQKIYSVIVKHINDIRTKNSMLIWNFESDLIKSLGGGDTFRIFYNYDKAKVIHYKAKKKDDNRT